MNMTKWNIIWASSLNSLTEWVLGTRIPFAHGGIPGELVTSFNDWHNYHTPINKRMCVDDWPLRLRVYFRASRDGAVVTSSANGMVGTGSGVTESLFGGVAMGGGARPSSGGTKRTASQWRVHNQKSNGGAHCVNGGGGAWPPGAPLPIVLGTGFASQYWFQPSGFLKVHYTLFFLINL